MVIAELAKQGKIYFTDQARERFAVHIQNSYKIAQDIYTWWEKKGLPQLLTFDSIATGDQTSETDSFYNLPSDQMSQALRVLQD